MNYKIIILVVILIPSFSYGKVDKHKTAPKGFTATCEDLIKDMGNYINKSDWDTSQVNIWIGILEGSKGEADRLPLSNYGLIKASKSRRDNNPLIAFASQYDQLLGSLKKYHDIKVEILGDTMPKQRPNLLTPHKDEKMEKIALGPIVLKIDSPPPAVSARHTLWTDLDDHLKPQYDSIEKVLKLLSAQIKALGEMEKTHYDDVKNKVEKGNLAALSNAVNSATRDPKYEIRNSYDSFKRAFYLALHDKLLPGN